MPVELVGEGDGDDQVRLLEWVISHSAGVADGYNGSSDMAIMGAGGGLLAYDDPEDSNLMVSTQDH